MKVRLKTLGLVLYLSLFGSKIFANGPKSLKSLSFDAVVKSIEAGTLKQSGLSDLPSDLQYSARIALEAIKPGKKLDVEYLKVLLDKSLSVENKARILALLKERGANDAKIFSLYNFINDQFKGDIETAFFNANLKDLPITKRKLLLDTGYIDINAPRDLDDRTELMRAAFHNNKDKIRILIALGADVNATDKSGKTALMWVVLNGDPAKTMAYTAKILVDAGANLTIKAGNKTALDLAKTISRNLYLRDYLQDPTNKKWLN